ncbi:HlyD family efflux transporter periplasmic adaptor subunit [uncultured Shewanella sp.]|uniref:HlyD family secretion protein n=1 Tax=uncultured Shewanella sp. TaxID=173975 RepID=UPI00261CD9EB|nr:HlyD family efflux transporter periplasmic adaptor subunit [uncultured Shewanella sp.]
MEVQFPHEKTSHPLNDKKVSYGSSKRNGYKLRWYLLLFIVLSPVFIVLYFIYYNYILIVAPGILTVNPIVIRASEDAIVNKINVINGQKISSGQHLVRMSNSSLTAEIEFIKKSLSNLKKEHSSTTQVDFSFYEKAISNAKDNMGGISKIKSDYDKYRNNSLVSELDYINIVNLVYSSEILLFNEKIRYNQALVDYQENKISGSFAKLVLDFEKELALKNSHLNNLNITSPFDGLVIETLVLEEHRVLQGEPIIKIAKNDIPQIIGYLKSEYVDRVKLGNSVTIIFPNGKKYSAKIALPTVLASKLPTQLAKPFEGQPALLKVTMSFVEEPAVDTWVEGMPVSILFN